MFKQNIFRPLELSELEDLESEYLKENSKMPRKLRKAIESERKGREAKQSATNTDYANDELVELACLVEEDEELGRDGAADLNELVLKEVTKSKAEKYDNDGLVAMKEGDPGHAIASLLQCLMVIKPLKDYFISAKYASLGPCRPDLRRRVLSAILTKILRPMYQSRIKYIREDEVSLNYIHALIGLEL